jgi:hypothetical protein
MNWHQNINFFSIFIILFLLEYTFYPVGDPKLINVEFEYGSGP